MLPWLDRVAALLLGSLHFDPNEWLFVLVCLALAGANYWHRDRIAADKRLVENWLARVSQ